MARYCVNRNSQSNGDHEVHNVDSHCAFLPDPKNRQDLGNHQNCSTAVSRAQHFYVKVNGCYHCAGACHTG